MVQCGLAVAKTVVIFDVVVDQRGFMENFNSRRHALDVFGNAQEPFGAVAFPRAAAGHGVVYRKRHKRPGTLASGQYEIIRQGLGATQGVEIAQGGGGLF